MRFRENIVKVIIGLGILAASLIAPSSLKAATNSDYTAVPPFMSTSIQPNVLIVLDNSGSMNDAAYATTYNPTQFASGQYYGLFDPTKYYQYTNNGRWEEVTGVTTAAPIPATGPSGAATTTNPIASGNLMNWANMSRISVAKKLLIGGKASPRSPAGAVTVKLYGETTWGFTKSFDNTSAPNLIAPFTGNYRYSVSSTANLSIVPVSAGVATFYTSPNADISLPAGWTVFPAAPTTAWDKVDDTIAPTPSNDGIATYIQAQNTASPAMFGYDYTGIKPAGTITVGVRVVAKKSTSSITARRIQGVLRIGGVDYAASFQPIGNTYTPTPTYSFNWATNPATGLAWQWSDIKDVGNPLGNLQAFGVQSYQAYTSLYPQVTQVYLVVTVSTPSGGPYSIIIDQGVTKAEGIIDRLGDKARFGLGYYNTSEGAHIAGVPQGEYVGFGAATNMITSISNLVPNTWTPLGETLYEMVRYIRQDTPYWAGDYLTGLNYDPYYYKYSTVSGSGLTDQYVPCAKSFVLMLTDGESTQDTNVPGTSTASPYAACSLTNIKACSGYGGLPNPRFAGTAIGTTYSSFGSDYLIDVAYWARTTDARPGTCTSTPTLWQQCIPDIPPETQNITIYPVFMFGKGSTLLKDASIYGGFEDMNNNNKPDCSTEPRECYRDSNGDGSVTSADDPATYYEGDDGFELETSITNAIASILKRSASGTSVSILATSAEGEGALYQAYFYPEKIMADGSKRDWLGFCRGLFLDSYGNLREDSNGDFKQIFINDKIVKMRLDTSTKEVKADLYPDTDENGTADAATPDTVKLDCVGDTTGSCTSITSIWEAGKKLALRDKGTRKIYTWVPDTATAANTGGFGSSSGTPMDFSTSNNTVLQPYLAAATSMDATNMISFTRGTSVTGYRNRCISITGATQETGCPTIANAPPTRSWPLGDIIYSTPTVVAATKEQYDLIYGESGYTAFRQKYNSRRNMVYVGANDGMIHAFNAGVYKAGDDATTTSVTEHGRFAANPALPAYDGWSAAIGDELWAFVPYDNLSHLQWLTQSTYQHVYYTDLKPKITDVRIFCDTGTGSSPPSPCVNGQSVSHPNGWGTILVVGMRLGGGAMNVSGDFDYNTLTPNTTKTFRSAYYVLDVTDPEKPPKLLWRFTDPGLGFTTSYPAFAHFKATTLTPEKWFMIVGSGPDNNEPTALPNTRGYDGSSTQSGKVFVFELVDYDSDGILLEGTFTADSNAFMGDPVSIDGNLDYNVDVIYIGSIIAKTSGRIYRITTNSNPDPLSWTLSTLFDPVPNLSDPDPDMGKDMGPLQVWPNATIDPFNNLWVFFGTGRLWDTTDKTNSDQQAFYGIKDGCWKSLSAGTCTTLVTENYAYKLSDMLDATNIKVQVLTATNSGTQVEGTTGCGGPLSCSYMTLVQTARSKKGWYVNLNNPTTPSERVLSPPVVLGGAILFTSFTPNTDICAMLGDSKLYALYYETGTAYNKPIVGISGAYINVSTDLGKGMPTTVGVAVGKKTKGFVQTSTGAIPEIGAELPKSPKSRPAAWKEREGGGGGGGTIDLEEIYKHLMK